MEKIKLLLYCNKSKPYLFESISEKGKYMLENNEWFKELNGKIVAECDFEVEKIDLGFIEYGKNEEEYNKKIKEINDILHKSCLNASQIGCYLTEDTGYAIHIKNLNIFDKPRELNEYADGKGYNIKKAPQSMMYACKYSHTSWNDIFDYYILISVSSQEMCRLLNGEQSVLVRKRVSKEML